MTDEQKWRWAVERLPALDALERAPATSGFDRWVGKDGTLRLYAAHLGADRTQGVKGYKPCTPLLFKLDAEQFLETRVPLDGTPARFDYPGDHMLLRLGDRVTNELVIVSKDEHGYGTGYGYGGPEPVLRTSSQDAIRYDAVPTAFDVDCASAYTSLACPDGSSKTCVVCKPELSEVVRGCGGAVGRGSFMPAKKTPTDCPPCPPDPVADQVRALDELACTQDFVKPVESGEAFFRDRTACLHAARALPPPEAIDHAHGFPLHPSLQLLCDDTYSTDLAPAALAAWYGPRLGKALVAAKGTWTATLHTAAADHTLTITRAATAACDTAPEGARALVLVESTLRR